VEVGSPLKLEVTHSTLALVWTVDDVFDCAYTQDLGMTIVLPHDVTLPNLLWGSFVHSKVKAGYATNLLFKFTLLEGVELRVSKGEHFVVVEHGCAREPLVKKFDRPTSFPAARPPLSSSSITVDLVRTTENAEVPRKATLGAAGFDLISTESVVIAGGTHMRVSTGLILEIPDDYFGRIVARSGLSYMHGIIVGAGIIDSDYRGPISVLLFNTTLVPCDIGVGDRIAQLMIERKVPVNFRVAESVTRTARGTGGFGSTGV
jgi:dUTP pyrophosphatase